MEGNLLGFFVIIFSCLIPGSVGLIIMKKNNSTEFRKHLWTDNTFNRGPVGTLIAYLSKY